MNSPHDVVHMNPTPPLHAGAKTPTQSQLERGQHFRERTALGAQNQPNADIYRANPSFRAYPADLFPLAANLRQETPPACTLFVQNLIAPIPIEPDCRSTNKHLWLGLRPRQRGSQASCPPHAALADCLLLRCRPAADNTFTGKMNHGPKAGHRGWRKIPHRLP